MHVSRVLYITVLKKTKKIFLPLWIILWVFHLETLTRPHSSTWESKGFKVLIAYAKCNRDSYDSELGFSSLIFHFLLISLVYFTRGRAKSWCGSICSWQKWAIFKVLLHLFYARFIRVFKVFNWFYFILQIFNKWEKRLISRYTPFAGFISIVHAIFASRVEIEKGFGIKGRRRQEFNE